MFGVISGRERERERQDTTTVITEGERERGRAEIGLIGHIVLWLRDPIGAGKYRCGGIWQKGGSFSRKGRSFLLLGKCFLQNDGGGVPLLLQEDG